LLNLLCSDLESFEDDKEFEIEGEAPSANGAATEGDDATNGKGKKDKDSPQDGNGDVEVVVASNGDRVSEGGSKRRSTEISSASIAGEKRKRTDVHGDDDVVCLE